MTSKGSCIVRQDKRESNHTVAAADYDQEGQEDPEDPEDTDNRHSDSDSDRCSYN